MSERPNVEVTMRAEGLGFINVEYKPDADNCGDNGDRYHLVIKAMSQPFEVDGKRDVEQLKITLVGRLEFGDFLNCIAAIRDRV
jgi:hypothetical protein